MRLMGWSKRRSSHVRDRRFLRQNNHKSPISMSTFHLHTHCPYDIGCVSRSAQITTSSPLKPDTSASTHPTDTLESIGALPALPSTRVTEKPPAIRICASALSSNDCPPSHESPAQTVGIQVRTLCLAFRAAVGQAVRSLLPSHSRRPVEPHDAAP